MKTLFTIIFVLVFFVPGLFLIYGSIFSIILLFIGDYTRFFGIVFSVVTGGLGFFSAAQLLNNSLEKSARIMKPLWLKWGLFFGLSSIVFILVNSPDTPDFLISVLLILPIPFVLVLMYLNRLYLWQGASKKT
jgi:hypothetical protein